MEIATGRGVVRRANHFNNPWRLAEHDPRVWLPHFQLALKVRGKILSNRGRCFSEVHQRHPATAVRLAYLLFNDGSKQHEKEAARKFTPVQLCGRPSEFLKFQSFQSFQSTPHLISAASENRLASAPQKARMQIDN